MGTTRAIREQQGNNTRNSGATWEQNGMNMVATWGNTSQRGKLLGVRAILSSSDPVFTKIARLYTGKHGNNTSITRE